MRRLRIVDAATLRLADRQCCWPLPRRGTSAVSFQFEHATKWQSRRFGDDAFEGCAGRCCRVPASWGCPTCASRIVTISPATVLDTDCRVYRVAGLRVVHASAMPTITSGNTNAPVMLVAERAARAILG